MLTWEGHVQEHSCSSTFWLLREVFFASPWLPKTLRGLRDTEQQAWELPKAWSETFENQRGSVCYRTILITACSILSRSLNRSTSIAMPAFRSIICFKVSSSPLIVFHTSMRAATQLLEKIMTNLHHLFQLFSCTDQSIMPDSKIFIASCPLSFTQQLLRTHSSKLRHFVLGKKRTD